MSIPEKMHNIEKYDDSRGKLLKYGKSSSPIFPAIIKRRKVSAFRDFPDGIRPSPLTICARRAKVVGSGSGGNISVEVIKCSENMESNAEKPLSLTNMVEMVTLPKNLDEVKTTVLPMKKANISRVYPPRRKVSCVRDFPSLCGKNAPCPSKLLLDQEKIVVEEKLMECGGINGIVDNVQEDCKNRKYEMIVSQNLVDQTKVNSPNDGSHETTRQFELVMSSEPKVDMDDKVQCARNFPSPCGKNDPCLSKLRLDQEKIVVDEKLMECSLRIKEVVDNVQENCKKRKHEIVVYGNLGDQTKVNSPKDGNNETTGQFEPSMSSEPKMDMKDKIQETFTTPNGSNLDQANNISHAPDMVLHLQMNRVVVQGLMAATSNCPWMLQKGSPKRDQTGKKISTREKTKYISKKKKPETKKIEGQSPKKNLSPKMKSDFNNKGELVLHDEVEFLSDGEENDNFYLSHRPRELTVSLPSLGQMTTNGSGNGFHDDVVTRTKVKETLRIFQVIYRKLLQEEEAHKSKGGGNGFQRGQRADLIASNILKSKNKCVNTGKQIIGLVPGIDVGDEFHLRVELAIVGLHRLLQAGIDYVRQGSNIIATSVVASTCYSDTLEEFDVLIYMGCGGQHEDQKLERANLALANSAHAKSPVRVIRGIKETNPSESLSSRNKQIAKYTYDGLYLVDKYWQELGPHDKLVYQFQLTRIPGQPELAWNELNRSRKLNVREGICENDISQGKELISICAINTIDDEKPPPFTYITKMIYPSGCILVPHMGCHCIKSCSETKRCSCSVKNGVEIPYNDDGAIVESKPLVYECGPSCKCPRTCPNRVSQHGIKYQLEIFRTLSRGWGVRSLYFISSGSFICEYMGELLDDKDAEKRTGSDEYLFDIWRNIINNDGDDDEMVHEGGFTIDAAQYGNIGRFINHSCSPNLIAQDVLYDHGDKRMPHIMLFAADNIPPLQELTYDYNYMIGQVLDRDGKIKEKPCYCGSVECEGRMY